jgi:hypothetical protein
MKDLKTIELNSAEISNLKYVNNVPEVVFIIWF